MKRVKTRGELRAESREQWQGILAEFERSGLSAREFSEGRGISASALGYWKKRTAEPRPLRFVSAVEVGRSPTPTGSGGGVVMEIGGSRIRIEPGFDAGLLLAVVRTLEGAVR